MDPLSISRAHARETRHAGESERDSVCVRERGGDVFMRKGGYEEASRNKAI